MTENTWSFICLSISENEYFPGGYISIDQNHYFQDVVEKPEPGKEPSNLVNLLIHYIKNLSELVEIGENCEIPKNNNDKKNRNEKRTILITTFRLFTLKPDGFLP